MIIKLICSNNNTRLILTSSNPSRFEGAKHPLIAADPRFLNRETKDTRISLTEDTLANEGGFTPSAKRPEGSMNSTIIFQLTTGMVGLKGATRSSIYGGENLYKKFVERLKIGKLYNNTFLLLVKGFGPTRHFLLRKLAQLKISKIKDITSYPHNGCRLPKSLRK